MDFFIADTHFHDTSIIKFIPPSIYKMLSINHTVDENTLRKTLDDFIIDAWNKMVKEEDTVYHLGDVGKFETLADARDIISKLHGKKVLVMGNHDSDPTYLPSCVNDISTYQKFWMDTGFDEVNTRSVFYDESTLLCHKPKEFCNDPYFMMFGHVHGHSMYRTISRNACCVSAERWLFAPVSIDTINFYHYQWLNDSTRYGDPTFDVVDATIGMSQISKLNGIYTSHRYDTKITR